MKTGENRGKELKNVWMNFSPTCHHKPERQCSTTIYCQHNSIFHSLHYLTSQNWGLSGQKNIWLVIMPGNLLSVILSPVVTEFSYINYSKLFTGNLSQPEGIFYRQLYNIIIYKLHSIWKSDFGIRIFFSRKAYSLKLFDIRFSDIQMVTSFLTCLPTEQDGVKTHD